MISDERIERAMEAYRVNGSRRFQGFCYGRCHVIRDLHLPHERQEIWSADGDIFGHDSAHELMIRELERIRMRAVLTADAPEIAVAEIRGLEMAKEIIHRDGPGVRVPLNAHALDTRIAELKAKTETDSRFTIVDVGTTDVIGKWWQTKP